MAGSALKPPRKMRPIEDRFWEKVDVRDPWDCWPWMAARDRLGYGKISAGRRKSNGGRDIKAHRFAYETLRGAVPDGLELDHLCRNASCVNPEHLEPVTHQENMLRGVDVSGVNARKTHCPQGHAYSPENTYRGEPTARRRGVRRQCRTCHLERQRARR